MIGYFAEDLEVDFFGTAIDPTCYHAKAVLSLSSFSLNVSLSSHDKPKDGISIKI